MANIGRGKLTVAPLPIAMQSAMWGPAVQLQIRLEEILDAPIDLWLTDNRRSLVSIQLEGSRYRVRLHHMFVEVEQQELQALADLATGSSPRNARAVVRSFARERGQQIRKQGPKRRTRIKTGGRSHDLSDLFGRASSRLDDKVEDVRVTWGRWGHLGPLTTVRLGSYCRRRKLVRIHPLLDRAEVPKWVIEFIIYHELLHHVVPPRKRGRRRIEHGEDFKERERNHPHFDRFSVWCKVDLPPLMANPSSGKKA